MNKVKKVFKWITFILAIIWITLLTTYSAEIIGTYIHEAQHAENAIGLKAIEVNYDGSGKTKAQYFKEDNEMHKWIYFNDHIVFMSLIIISLLSIMVLIIIPIDLQWRKE